MKKGYNIKIFLVCWCILVCLLCSCTQQGTVPLKNPMQTSGQVTKAPLPTQPSPQKLDPNPRVETYAALYGESQVESYRETEIGKKIPGFLQYDLFNFAGGKFESINLVIWPDGHHCNIYKYTINELAYYVTVTAEKTNDIKIVSPEFLEEDLRRVDLPKELFQELRNSEYEFIGIPVGNAIYCYPTTMARVWDPYLQEHVNITNISLVEIYFQANGSDCWIDGYMPNVFQQPQAAQFFNKETAPAAIEALIASLDGKW